MRRFLQLDGDFTATTGDVRRGQAVSDQRIHGDGQGVARGGRDDVGHDLLAVAELHIRLAASLVQVSSPVLDVTDDDAVATYARTHLAPLVR